MSPALRRGHFLGSLGLKTLLVKPGRLRDPRTQEATVVQPFLEFMFSFDILLSFFKLRNNYSLCYTLLID